MKQKMERMQVLNDGADEEDFKELLQILRSFGEVEVLYDPNDPKDKDVTADEVIGRFDNFKKKVKMNTNALNNTEDEETREDGSSTEGCVPDATERVRKRRRRSRLNETDTTISTAA
jgi:hypothetical protein|nr:MAG TPA: hypothetical protein [Caudoviricetes sp.]